MPANISVLGKPITLPHSKKVVPTRFLKAAMSEKICSYDAADVTQRGRPGESYTTLYREWGAGGFGIIVSGNIMINRDHLEAPGNAIIDERLEDYTREFAATAKAAKVNGALLVGQISHPGRQAHGQQPNPVSASDVQAPPFWNGMVFGKPTPLTHEGIKDVVGQFAHASVVLHAAGWDGVQLHGAHGYLLSQFLSPRTNLRTDQYGGSLENRSRIIFEIIDEIRRRVPDPSFSISIKLNSADFSDGGLSAEDSQKLTQMLEEARVDSIELSGGTYESFGWAHQKESTKKREGYFVEFAEGIRPHLKQMVLAVTGGFRSAPAIATAINEGVCDIVGLGRPVAAEPRLPADLISGKSEKAKEPKWPPALAMWNSAADMQVVEISRGEQPTDYSIQENVDKFIAAMPK